MSSLLTNTSAMVALQTLKGINEDMATTQNRISTGKRVNDASDNAAYWSIATTMNSDNKALSAVEDALGLGAATVDVAFTAMDKAVEVVDEIKAKLTTASEPGVDREKIQKDISALQEQLATIAGSANFNGENWLEQDTLAGDYNATKEVVGSFTRDSNGAVQLDKIQIDTTDILLVDAGTSSDTGILDKDLITETLGTATFTKAVFAPDGSVTTAATLTGTIDTVAGRVLKEIVENDPTNQILANDPADIADKVMENLSGDSILDLDISELTDSVGDLALLGEVINVVDTQLQAMTDAATSLGSAKSRIDMQKDFVSELGDAIDRGVGQLVDADMNEESTRLKALETQQQLGIQALSIANSSSQNILSLFR